MSESASADERKQIVDLLVTCGAVRFGQFTLTSGQTSNLYIDVKRAWTDPKRLTVLAEALGRRVGNAQRLAGMELGAVPLIVATALRTGLPYVVIRKAAREHGTKQRFEGEIPAGARVLLIEDASSTGGSALESVRVIREAGGVVTEALVVVDREMGAIDRLRSEGIRLMPLVTVSEIPGAGA